jgi:hypothetical protein
MSARRFLLLAYVGFALLFLSQSARADAPSRRTSFAVVIGNNASLDHRRPDLHYADDDAAKYFAILDTIAPDRAYLLADFDEDTARLFPAMRTRATAPTRTELARVGQEIASRVRAVTGGGGPADVYFVFAGHGDVDQGTGFIELADARFTSDDLEQWLRAIPFTRAHVILDSCNSFFMLSERKPGGRYYATSEDAARSLASKLPNVGVFLSTSAEGESFEWSEIQSGVFSHVVRSGLLGAADADGDGNVSYLELAAFVATATADVSNPNMRPHVFSRGPGGRDDLPIVSRAGRTGAKTFRLTHAAPMRLRLRDREAVPLLDANEEAGLPLPVTLPSDWTDGAVIERAGTGGASALLETFAIPATPGDVTLASMQPITPRGAGRGPAEIFQRLFQRPFGPRAVAAFMAEAKSAPAPVYGVSEEDAKRMGLLLDQIGAAEHGRRLVGGSAFVGIAALYGALGATAFAFDRSDPATSKRSADTAGAVILGLGAVSLGAGIYELARPWSSERLAADYCLALEKGDDAQAFARANDRLEKVAAAEQRERWMRGIVGGVVALGSAAAIAGVELSGPTAAERLDGRAIGGAGVVFGLVIIASSLWMETPVAHLTKVWREDPARVRILPTVAPVQGGGTLGITGVF